MAAMLFVGAGETGKMPWLAFVSDKVLHFFYYGVMALLLAHGVGRRWAWVPLVFVPLVGVLDEWNQFYTPGRDSSVWDWAADVAGMAVFVYAYRRATRSTATTAERPEDQKAGPIA